MTYREATTDHGKKLIPADSALDGLAADVANKRNLLTAATEQEKVARLACDEAETALFDALENQGLRAIRTPLGLFSLNDQAWAKIADPVLAREWAENELPEAITLNSTRLSKVVRDRLKAGDDLPPGVDVSFKRSITWRKSE